MDDDVAGGSVGEVSIAFDLLSRLCRLKGEKQVVM
jgi:hypothetical protein